MSNLNPKQKNFVHEYLKTLNVTQLTIKAGYIPQSYYVQGSQTIKNEKGVRIYKRAKRTVYG